MTNKNLTACNEQFCKSWGEVQNSIFVLLLSGSTILNISASISQPSQSCQTLAVMLKDIAPTNKPFGKI